MDTNLNKTKNVGIFIFNDAEVLDFAGPFEVFSVTSQLNDHKPYRVFTISKTTDPILAVNGLRVMPDYSIDNHPEIDILIISGGQGTRPLLSDDDVLRWLLHISESSEATLGICSAARLLAKVNLLDNVPYCTHHEVYDHVNTIAPTAIPCKEKRYVQSRQKLFTSGGISAGIDLSFHIIEKTLGKEIAANTARYMEYRLV